MRASASTGSFAREVWVKTRARNRAKRKEKFFLIGTSTSWERAGSAGKKCYLEAPGAGEVVPGVREESSLRNLMLFENPGESRQNQQDVQDVIGN
jgi:hypothetical protein